MSGVFQSVMVQLGIQKVKSMADHPQNQGVLKKVSPNPKNHVKDLLYEQKADWDKGIPLLLFAARELMLKQPQTRSICHHAIDP